jgi:acyl-CoA reductase-like NAD-dependent aldehyde dehydrogenase
MGGERDDPPDVLQRLEQRLDEASARAQRLVVEAAEAALRAAPPPAAGWEAPTTDEPSSRRRGEFELLLGAAQALRDLIPPELQRRLTDALRELLTAMRALLDWYIERLDRRQESSSEVEDIPIL